MVGSDWGLGVGTLVACLLLTNQLMQPVAEIGEVLDQTQTAISGWRKILMLLQQPVDIVEPVSGVKLPKGPLPVEVSDVSFAYDDGPNVLSDVNISIPAGLNVAIVGETGSGKSTLSKLLCRLADPTAGSVRLGGVDLRQIAPESRRSAVRLVPQDGFLFNTSILENVRMGNPAATDDEVLAAFADLGLLDWLNRLPNGIHTEVGQRGDGISVGERQLVALARAKCLILACSCWTRPLRMSTPTPSAPWRRRWRCCPAVDDDLGGPSAVHRRGRRSCDRVRLGACRSAGATRRRLRFRASTPTCTDRGSVTRERSQPRPPKPEPLRTGPASSGGVQHRPGSPGRAARGVQYRSAQVGQTSDIQAFRVRDREPQIDRRLGVGRHLDLPRGHAEVVD